MTPVDVEAVSRRAVERELHATPIAVQPIPVGHSNHVAKVDTVEGRSFVVRVSRSGADRFEMEEAVMRTVSEVGVPVPHVRFIGPTSETNGAVMISDWVDAPSLASARDDTDASRRDLADRLADTLVAIHSCAVRGFGNLDANLRGRADAFVDWFVAGAVDQLERSTDVIARHAPGGAGLPARAAAVLAQQAHLLAWSTESLVHGDFSPSNLLVNGTTLAAVIDWESAKGGPAALDFGWLAYVDTEPVIDHERLMARYAHLTGHDVDELLAQSRLVELRILATAAEWQARAQLTAEIPATLQRLAESLRQF